jgi:hypothetical protein
MISDWLALCVSLEISHDVVMGKCRYDMSSLKCFTMCLIGCVVFYLVYNYFNSANYNGIIFDTCLPDTFAEKLRFLNADPNLLYQYYVTEGDSW